MPKQSKKQQEAMHILFLLPSIVSAVIFKQNE
jgi:hypothetical protein